MTEFKNAKYVTFSHENGRGNIIFDIDIVRENKTIPYTFEDIEEGDELHTEIYNLFHSGQLEVAEYDGSRENLEYLKYEKINELTEYKRILIENELVEFNDDFFDCSDKSITRLTNFIQTYSIKISNKTISKDEIEQEWISNTGIIHKLSFVQLIELNELIMNKVQEITLHLYKLKNLINDSVDPLFVYKISWNSKI